MAGPTRPRGTTAGGSNPRFPGFDVLSQADTWDQTTAGVVLARTSLQPALRFFTPAEEAIAGSLFDQLLAQWDEPKVAVLQMVDARLAELQSDGWRYEEMPEDAEAWRRSLHALDQDAGERFGGAGFAELTRSRQSDLIQAVQDLGGESWHDIPAGHVWSLWTRYACTAFYSHPWAWNEIGFGGPAYPRGYARLGIGLRERWEAPDQAPTDPVEATGRKDRDS
ncbi:gluconate 2-dehydrogenase subunit 3 family protein [Kitasatospora sp. NPDC056138]|uniref:gluconate 2-dehydrogenase subunit 3 family protein n=1 Tax=Kitasatospora sp. NPDC056138 TaxID=3345724 RepID=UPI0035E2E463